MCDIIFIHIVGTPTEITAMQIRPAAGISYFASYMRELGYTSKFVFVSQDEKYNELVDLTIDADIKGIILKEKPKIVAFSPLTPTYNKAVELVKLIKEISPQTITCIGNVHATAFPEQALRDGFDYVFLREGFVTFPRFVKKVMNGGWNLDKIICSEETITDQDTIPFITFEDVTPSSFGIPFGLIFFSFACPFSCRFCTNEYFTGLQWKKLRPRNPKRVVEEIKYQHDMWGFNLFGFIDPTLLPDKASFQKLVELNRMTDQLNFEPRYYIACRLDILARLEKEDPALLDQALRNVDMVFVGIEVMNDNILNSYNKSLTTNEIVRGIEALKIRGKTIIAGFIIGGPNDTYETIETMVKYIKKFDLAFTSISIFTPYPLTDYYREFEEKGLLLTKNWDLYDERHLVYRHPVFKLGELEKTREDILNLCTNPLAEIMHHREAV